MAFASEDLVWLETQNSLCPGVPADDVLVQVDGEGAVGGRFELLEYVRHEGPVGSLCLGNLAEFLTLFVRSPVWTNVQGCLDQTVHISTWDVVRSRTLLGAVYSPPGKECILAAQG